MNSQVLSANLANGHKAKTVVINRFRMPLGNVQVVLFLCCQRKLSGVGETKNQFYLYKTFF